MASNENIAGQLFITPEIPKLQEALHTSFHNKGQFVYAQVPELNQKEKKWVSFLFFDILSNKLSLGLLTENKLNGVKKYNYALKYNGHIKCIFFLGQTKAFFLAKQSEYRMQIVCVVC